MADLAQRLARGVVVLDGAMGSQLEARGVDTSTPLWSALALLEDPDAVQAVHTSYFAAGAQVATTDSYQASLPGFAALGLNDSEGSALIVRSVSLARRAAQSWRAAHPGTPLMIAGSVGPYGAFLADGSEYRGDYDLSRADYRAFHRPRLQALADGGVDVFAVETQPNVDEARTVVELIAAEFPQIPAWLSFQLHDPGTLADGTALAEAVHWADGQSNLLAVGVNCVAPGMVQPALETIAPLTRLPLVCYPNSASGFQSRSRSWQIDPALPRLAQLVPDWVEAGARLIGGCCRSTPDDIAALARTLDRTGPHEDH